MDDVSALFDTDSVRRFEASVRRTLPAGELMERAGRAAWQEILRRWPAAGSLLFVCGSGGNGGDGYVAARHAFESGRQVHVVLVGDGAEPGADAAVARSRFIESGGTEARWNAALPTADVVVDALLGIGLVGGVRDEASRVIDAINACAAPVLSLDVPSGVGSQGVDGPAVHASASLEFLLPKTVLRTGPALDHRGDVALARLDVSDSIARPGAVAHLAVAASLQCWLKPRRRDSHKGASGRVLCIGGAPGAGGAILLCAEAALRAGSGLVRVATDASHAPPLLARLPEAMVADLHLPLDFDWPNAVAIGPGLGQGDVSRNLVECAVGSERALVLDADALNILATSPRMRLPTAVMTPHPGEAARLLGCDIGAIQRDRFGAAAALATRFGCVVVLKGAGSIVAHPCGTPVVIAAGNPGMAVGGMGDALTGIIAALIAQGLPLFDAACCGALLHAAAGDAAAADGERGLLPSDLMPHIRRLANP